jgi:hypothetical protein
MRVIAMNPARMTNDQFPIPNGGGRTALAVIGHPTGRMPDWSLNRIIRE